MGNGLEARERTIKQVTTTIEFCGTPFASREKFFVDNAIEDMIAERVGEKIGSAQGVGDHGWPTTLDTYTKIDCLTKLDEIRSLYIKKRPHHNIFLIQDGIFSGLVMAEILRRNHVFSEEEAHLQSDNLLLYASMTDRVLLTLVNPRAALTRFIFPQEIEGYDILRQAKFIFYSVFNQAARNVLAKYGSRFPSIEVLDVPGDEFRRDDIFFWNADMALGLLGLPSIKEWSKKLEKIPRQERIFPQAVVRSTMAGLTEEELKAKLIESDWSQNPGRKQRALNISRQVIGYIEKNVPGN